MARSLYLINPCSDTPGYFGAEVYQRWGFPPAQAIADLPSATVAALVPAGWHIELCDEYVQPVDFDTECEVVAITGKITQGRRMVALADEFRRRGKTVVIGGPYASLSPEVMRGHCDVLVIGELEAIHERLFADLEKGSFDAEYVADKPDLATSPLPRWDLYPHHRALEGCVQTSRGCPFECEFCDVIQYLGRQQRHKPVESIIAELDALYALGFRTVFLADDNFTVYRKRAKAILAALADWNTSRPDGPVSFSTQVSIDAARDPEIMELLAESGMRLVFIGIETPNVESLKETKKRQNVGVNLLDEVQVFLDHGVMVTGGMIVGFDHDGLDIFERQYEFAMASPIPMFTLGALVAPAATPLHERMERTGRLVEGGSEVAASPWSTNVVPTMMSREQLFDGLKWLCNKLYRPEEFGRRTLAMIERLGPPRGPFAEGYRKARSMRPVETEGLSLLRKFIRSGTEERRMWGELSDAIDRRPDVGGAVLNTLLRYAQARTVYEEGSFWEPHVAATSPFAASAAAATQAPADGLVTLGSGAAG